jgi:GntP family gluconate:H+ symporter
MMNPIAKTLASKSSISYAATIVAVSLGAMVSHSLIPPTPGPIATAGILGADLGQVILYGTIISLVALIPVYFFVQKWVTKISVRPRENSQNQEILPEQQPKLVSSLLPILTPLGLIFLASIASYPTKPLGESTFAELVTFLGNPLIALSIGVLFSFALPIKLDRKLFSATGWIGEALLAAAPVIFITGAGAVFGKMLQNSGIGMVVANSLQGANWGLFLPFLLAFGLKCAQGSTTVAMITTASIVAPLLSPLGLDTDMLKVFTTLAIGSGALAISHANDSAFWVVTQLSGMSTKQGNLSHSLGTFITSISAMTALYLISLVVA